MAFDVSVLGFISETVVTVVPKKNCFFASQLSEENFSNSPFLVENLYSSCFLVETILVVLFTFHGEIVTKTD